MSIGDMIKAVADNGITVVICSVAIWVACKLIGIAFKRMNTRSNNKKHDKLINVRDEVGKEIQILLDEFISNSGGRSIQVIEFSNSVTSVAFLPFRYMTCTYESCRFGAPSIGNKIDHMSTSLFTPFFNAMKNKQYCVFDVNSKDNLMGGAMYDLFLSLGTSKSLCSMLCTVKGKAVGYITFQRDEPFTEKDMEGIQSLSKQIQALLCVLDN